MRRGEAAKMSLSLPVILSEVEGSASVDSRGSGVAFVLKFGNFPGADPSTSLRMTDF
jgi:hypothetical protein